jgi:hypothetical protein
MERMFSRQWGAVVVFTLEVMLPVLASAVSERQEVCVGWGSDHSWSGVTFSSTRLPRTLLLDFIVCVRYWC